MPTMRYYLMEKKVACKRHHCSLCTCPCPSIPNPSPICVNTTDVSIESNVYDVAKRASKCVCVCVLRVACCCWHRFRSGNWHLVIYLSIAPKRGRAQWHNGKADDRGVCVCDTPLATMNTRIPEKLQSFEIVAVAFSGWLSEWVMNRFIISTDNCADSLNDIAVIHKHYRKFNMHD